MLCDQSAFYAQRISQGNTPTALPTPGTAGQSVSPITSLSLAGSNRANNPLATTLPYSQSNTQSVPNTNTALNAPLKSIYIRFSVVLLELGCECTFFTTHLRR